MSGNVVSILIAFENSREGVEDGKRASEKVIGKN